MARQSNSFGRDRFLYKPQPRILVICEDIKSSLDYLKDASSHFRSDVDVEVVHAGYTDPLGIVKQALKRQGKLDHVYCVIDRDTHANFDEAIALAGKSPKITVIPSFPCFEFWLLIHFKDTRRPFARTGDKSAADMVVRDLQKCKGMESYAKGDVRNLFASLLGGKFDHARDVSPRILRAAIEDGNLNPSTRIHELMVVFESLSSPQKA